MKHFLDLWAIALACLIVVGTALLALLALSAGAWRSAGTIWAAAAGARTTFSGVVKMHDDAPATWELVGLGAR